MKWIKIVKLTDVPEEVDHYRDYKPYLRVEAGQQCIYCAIQEALLGNVRSFQVEHYRPKSRDEFKHLEKEYGNLFYACLICNNFKGSDWPNEPNADLNIAFYPDPSEIDYNDLFETDPATQKISGLNATAKYIEERLFLNRPQLILARREALVWKRKKGFDATFDDLFNRLTSAMSPGNPSALEFIQDSLRTLGEIRTEIATLVNSYSSIPPFEPGDEKR